jgi:hypothetical protein
MKLLIMQFPQTSRHFMKSIIFLKITIIIILAIELLNTIILLVFIDKIFP